MLENPPILPFLFLHTLHVSSSLELPGTFSNCLPNGQLLPPLLALQEPPVKLSYSQHWQTLIALRAQAVGHPGGNLLPTLSSPENCQDFSPPCSHHPTAPTLLWVSDRGSSPWMVGGRDFPSEPARQRDRQNEKFSGMRNVTWEFKRICV